MLNKGARTIALLSASLLFFGLVALAVIEVETVRFEQPVKAIRGRVTAFGQVMRVVWVDVYDNAQLSLDDSMSEVERRIAVPRLTVREGWFYGTAERASALCARHVLPCRVGSLVLRNCYSDAHAWGIPRESIRSSHALLIVCASGAAGNFQSRMGAPSTRIG
jgi:hypothetical protein